MSWLPLVVGVTSDVVDGIGAPITSTCLLASLLDSNMLGVKRAVCIGSIIDSPH